MIFDLTQSPFDHFKREFKKASSVVTKDVNAMSLATCAKSGVPSLRTVLFKGMVRDGFSFYTNYESQKSREISLNPQVAALFFWTQLEQQIRIQGVADKLIREESEAYFKTRPRISQIGAWASEQSEYIVSGKVLTKRVEDFEKKFAGQDVPCPPNWGGWRIQPLQIEFWFGHVGRLHERYVYTRAAVDAKWTAGIKAP